jgi:hypothetical protein
MARMKTDTQRIDFIMHAAVDGRPITPETIDLATFNEFNQQVAEFISGSEHLKLDQVRVSVGQGSYRLTVTLMVAIMAALVPDLKRLKRQDVLGEIDPKRAEVLAKWQNRVKADREFRYVILPEGPEAVRVELNSETDYRVGEVVPWVKVEKYLFGKVLDMGGAQKANIYIRLDDSGELVRITTAQEYLEAQEKNRLYHKVLVRVQGEQHHRTGELRNLRLLSFEDYEPQYDKAALDRFAQAGRRAWADVPDGGKWLRKLRGGS